MRIRLLAAAAAGAVSILGPAACASPPPVGNGAQRLPSAAASAPPNPYGVATIDPPSSVEPVLTVQGGSAPLALTLDALNELGSTTVTLDEPFVKR